MSYDNTNYGYTSEGFDANPSGYFGRECWKCFSSDTGECGECAAKNIEAYNNREKLVNSAKYKEGTKLIAGLYEKRQIKLALIHKLHRDSLDLAIERYMVKEALPSYYALILKSDQCIDKIVGGILYKVCHIRTNLSLDEQIAELCCTVRANPNFLSPYDRVTQIQQFIHRTINQYLGEGAACLIPISPIKNALSAARLHLSIFDVMRRDPVYTAYLEDLARAESRLEYDEPRPAQIPQGKRYYPRWRVRHLQPLSYFHTKEQRLLIDALMNIDETIESEEFVDKALMIFSQSA